MLWKDVRIRFNVSIMFKMTKIRFLVEKPLHVKKDAYTVVEMAVVTMVC